MTNHCHLIVQQTPAAGLLPGPNSKNGTMSPENQNTGETVEVDIFSRALIKHARAGELFQSLEDAVDRWNEEHQLMAPVRSPYDGDQRLEYFRPQALDQIPLFAWESTFHDGVHNLRVALDTLCFELCNLEQPAPDPGRIHFPITNHPNEWPDRTKHLGTMPPPLLERMRLCQPWERPDFQTPDPLRLISRIDNVDKHRAAGVNFDVIPAGQWGLRPSAPLPPELANSLDWPLTPWIQLTITPPVDRGVAELLPVAALPVVLFEGLSANLADAQRWLHSEVQRVIEFIASGEWPEARFNRLLPEPTWSVITGPDSNGPIEPS